MSISSPNNYDVNVNNYNTNDLFTDSVRVNVTQTADQLKITKIYEKSFLFFSWGSSVSKEFNTKNLNQKERDELKTFISKLGDGDSDKALKGKLSKLLESVPKTNAVAQKTLTINSTETRPSTPLTSAPNPAIPKAPAQSAPSSTIPANPEPVEDSAPPPAAALPKASGDADMTKPIALEAPPEPTETEAEKARRMAILNELERDLEQGLPPVQRSPLEEQPLIVSTLTTQAPLPPAPPPPENPQTAPLTVPRPPENVNRLKPQPLTQHRERTPEPPRAPESQSSISRPLDSPTAPPEPTVLSKARKRATEIINDIPTRPSSPTAPTAKPKKAKVKTRTVQIEDIVE